MLVLFWTYIHHSANSTILSLIECIFRSIARDGMKGNPTDFLLDVSIDWIDYYKQSVKEEFEPEVLLKPIILLRNELRTLAAFNEKMFVDGIVCYFVKASELLALILLEQEKGWISKRGESMLEVGIDWLVWKLMT